MSQNFSDLTGEVVGTYESSSARKVTFSAVVLGVAFIVFAAGYGARVVEERSERKGRAMIEREPTMRAP